MRDAERGLAALEDQRHNQVLLVVEMPDQPREQGAAGVRVVVAAAAERVGVAGERAISTRKFSGQPLRRARSSVSVSAELGVSMAMLRLDGH